MYKFLKRLFSLLLILLALCLLIFYYAYKVEPFHYKTTSLELHSSLLTLNGSTLSVVYFADTHFGDYYSTNDFKKVVSKINALKPDFVIFGGDLIDDYNTYSGDVSQISLLLSQINATTGKYCVFGNHDYGGGAEFEYPDIMAAGGFSVLKNQSVQFKQDHLTITGIDDVLIGYGNPDVAKNCRADFYNIVVCHEPDIADQLMNYNVDFLMAGHTHGRQINISRFDDYILPPYGKKYIKGEYDFDNARMTKLYVNSGIGMTKLPFRFASPPEITQVVLHGK